MLNKIYLVLFLILFSANAYSAGSESSSSDSTKTKVKSNYEKAVTSINFAKKNIEELSNDHDLTYFDIEQSDEKVIYEELQSILNETD